jgi:tRNA (guanine-N7-)-methyltransferase
MTLESKTPRTDEAGALRSVRSFVLRAGRLTDAQRRALEHLWPRYGVNDEGPIDPRTLYGRAAPWTVEVGFGNGDALLALAAAHPEVDFLGIEVHPPGIGRLLLGLAEAGLANVRVVRADAALVLARRLPTASVDRLNVWFPDPWPKKRHQKRRLVQPDFVHDVARVLRPGGALHLATDWEDYARQMLDVGEAEPLLVNLAGPGRFHAGPGERPVTRFHARGARLGHGVWDLLLTRRADLYPLMGSGA